MLRLGIIGTGRMAARMIACAAHLPGVQVTAVASGTAGRADAVAGKIGATACLSAAELSARHDVDAVYIASRNADHAPAALAAIAAGKPALVEKPLATMPDDAAGIVAAARSAGVLLVENLWCLALPASRALIARADAGTCGTPLGLTFDFGYPVTRAAYPSLYGVDAGVLRDRGVYGLSLALRLLGPVEHLTAQARWDGQTDIAATVHLKHASGALSQVAVAFDALLANTATLACTEGMLRLDPSIGSESLTMQSAPQDGGAANTGRFARLKSIPAARALNRWRKAPKVETFSFGPDPYLPMLSHFRDLIVDRRAESPLVPLELSLETQRLIAMALGAAGDWA